METNILRRIFFDHHHHWEVFIKKHDQTPRPIVRKEMEKFRDCGNPKNGFKLFVCEGCHDPMICHKCSCYFEYKGEVCPQDGELVKKAVCETSHQLSLLGLS
ncbi:transposase zinc-binding domain-containing protein [Bacillus sp. F19]|nr:transposase zinc-binding domain-containing protein [Bacillus sp. F19]